MILNSLEIWELPFKYYSIKGQKTWTNELPHVIYGSVIIEPNATLTIEEGAEIYFHSNSGIDVGNKILIYLTRLNIYKSIFPYGTGNEKKEYLSHHHV